MDSTLQSILLFSWFEWDQGIVTGHVSAPCGLRHPSKHERSRSHDSVIQRRGLEAQCQRTVKHFHISCSPTQLWNPYWPRDPMHANFFLCVKYLTYPRLQNFQIFSASHIRNFLYKEMTYLKFIYSPAVLLHRHPWYLPQNSKHDGSS